MWVKFQMGKMNNFYRWMMVVNALNAIELYNFKKIVKLVNCLLCINTIFKGERRNHHENSFKGQTKHLEENKDIKITPKSSMY